MNFLENIPLIQKNLTKKTLLIILGVIFLFIIDVICIAMILQIKRDNATPPPPSFITIKITPHGFEPPLTKIPLGTKVIFKNDTSDNRWVASDDHPSHAKYPSFDSKRPIPPQKSWEFIFSKKGSWNYHDHLFPKQTGRITVTTTQTSETYTSESSEQALVAKLTTIALKNGSIQAWEYFSQLDKKNLMGLHDVAHFLGSVLYDEHGVTSLKYCDESYAFGCYHGVLEAYIADKGVSSLAEVVKFCDSDLSQVAVTCYHGIGHGVLPHFNYSLDNALHECDTLLGTSKSPYCQRGVFMEFASMYVQEAKIDDPLWPCSTITTPYKLSCYDYQKIFLVQLFPDDEMSIEKACLSAESKEYQIKCIDGYGHLVAQTTKYDPDTIISRCKKMSDEGASICISAAAVEMVFQKQSIDLVQTKLCEYLKTAYKENCYNRTNTEKRIQSTTDES